MSQRRTGRIRPHERDTDDTVEILGANISVSAEHTAAVKATERQDLNEKNKRNYRNRIKHIYEWLEITYPEYYKVGVVELSEAQLEDEDMFWWKNKLDLIYEGMNVGMIKAFLAFKKQKENGKCSSHVQLRKYNDAILWGAKTCHQRLPLSYYEEMDKFLVAFKKETTMAKKDGMLDEQEADPITWTLFRKILQWALDRKNIYLWVFSILQWNCMARSINIGVLALHCFRVGEDCIIVRYDKSKADQTGEKVSDKHVYDNPFDPLVSVFLALGVWFCLESARFENTESLFQDDENEVTAASQRYCSQLTELFKAFHAELVQFIRADHANTHGIRKGSATKASSGTTCPPPVSSIASRGEWSMGKILDLYWHFAEPGDTYLGRILAGLDPNEERFGSLPPHWKVGNPMGDARIREAMHLMFGSILERWGGSAVDPTGILMLCLASIVWNVDFLKETAARIPGHPFGMIPLLSNAVLLAELKLLVTIESEGHMTVATGIPPHIRQAVLIKATLDVCRETFEAIKLMAAGVTDAVKKGFEEKAFECGQMTGERMKDMLLESHSKIETLIDLKLAELKNNFTPNNQNDVSNENDADDGAIFADGEEEEIVVENEAIRHRLYAYEGRFWHVPKDFEFPLGVHLDTGWKLWICGLPSNETVGADDIRVQAPVRPFRILKPAMLPPDARKKFQLHWKPIFSLMEAAPDLEIASEMNTDAISLSFSVGKQYLKTRVSYIFDNLRSAPDQWGISTWSKKVARSSIKKHGNVSDIAFLPEPNRHNQPRQLRNPRRTRLANNPRTQRRARVARVAAGEEEHAMQEEPAAADNQQEEQAEEEADAGEEPDPAHVEAIERAIRERAVEEGMTDEIEDHMALTEDEQQEEQQGGTARARMRREEPAAADGELPTATLTGNAVARGEEIERAIRVGQADELREMRRLANLGRPDGHGGTIFIGPRFPI
jgi:hypothetical protein